MKTKLRPSFLALSISIALLSTILGLSATLTQAQNQTSYFVVEADGAFGIELTGEDYSTATKILPGNQCL